MIWTDDLKAVLLDLETDQDMLDAFPGQSLENLKRRRREFRAELDVNKTETSKADRLGRLADLLEKSKIPIEEIDRVKQIKVNEWQGFYKDDDGVAHTVDMSSQTLVLTPKWEEGPAWPPVQPVEPAIVTPIDPFKTFRSETGLKTVVILPDTQIGYWRDPDSGELIPFHDERAIKVALAIVQFLQPGRIINLGDLLDLADWSTKFVQLPTFRDLTQQALDYAHLYLARQRANAPGADIDVIEGNHDHRMPGLILTNAAAAYGLRRANTPGSWPVLSVPHLLRMEELNVKYHSGYPANIVWVTERLACIHGKITKGGYAGTAKKYVDTEKVSTIFGHIHKQEVAYSTTHSFNGANTTFAACVGCLCRVDGFVPSMRGGQDVMGRPVPVVENWQQGIGVVTYDENDGLLNLETVPIRDGRALFRGYRFEHDKIEFEGNRVNARV